VTISHFISVIFISLFTVYSATKTLLQAQIKKHPALDTHC